MAKTEFTVCLGKSCRMNFSEDLLKECEKSLKCGLFDESDDGKFELSSVACLKNCEHGPTLRIDDYILSQVSPKEAKLLIKAHQNNNKNFLDSIYKSAQKVS